VKDAAEGLNVKAGASAFNFATTVAAAAATLLVEGADLVCASPPPPSSTSSHESGSAITKAHPRRQHAEKANKKFSTPPSSAKKIRKKD
jgi:hypothetical protein